MDDFKLNRAIMLNKNIQEIKTANKAISDLACTNKTAIHFTVISTDGYGEEKRFDFKLSGYDNVNEIIEKLLIPYFSKKQNEVEQDYKKL